MDGMERPVGRRMLAGHTLYEDGSIVFEEFREGDPRRGPHSLSVQNTAEAKARMRKRWHQRKRYVDWLAIRLVFGRGCSAQQAGKMFGIETSSVRRRAQEEDWASPLSACDRHELSVLVWLAGWRRIDPDDAESRTALKKASEWRLMKDEQEVVWREKNRQGATYKFTINDEIPDDVFFSEADPKREERRAVVNALEARLQHLEAVWDEEAEKERLEEEAEECDRPGEASDQVCDLAGGVDAPGGGDEGVAGVGAADTTST